MTPEDIVKWLLGLFAALVSGGLWLLVNAVRETRVRISSNSKDLHKKIDAVGREMRTDYVRLAEFKQAVADLKENLKDNDRQTREAIRENTGKVDALVTELIKHRLDIARPRNPD
jgi:hypothetical protein